MSRIKEELDEIIENQEVLIYGAGLMGKNLLTVLKSPLYNKRIAAFVVNNKEGNPSIIDGIQVLSIEEVLAYKDMLVLVALHEKHIQFAINELRNAGFSKIIPISFDNDLWSNIREQWLMNTYGFPYGAECLNSNLEKQLHIYVVHSEADKELCEIVTDTPHEISIQVGVDLAEHRLFPVLDNVGDNISYKNKQYCELTGLYWIWKNDKSDYVGLSHYRRKFILNDKEIEKIISGSVDMVVTVPVMNLGTVKGQYAKDHSETDWNIMVEAVNELSPEYSQALKLVGEGTFYFAYNMFIAKRRVFDDYCSWLFKILKYCENKIGQKDDSYQNRYVGFLAERLLTVYIAKHKELKVVVAKKHFIETKVN